MFHMIETGDIDEHSEHYINISHEMIKRYNLSRDVYSKYTSPNVLFGIFLLRSKGLYSSFS